MWNSRKKTTQAITTREAMGPSVMSLFPFGSLVKRSHEHTLVNLKFSHPEGNPLPPASTGYTTDRKHQRPMYHPKRLSGVLG